jgi:hypothetical protein
VDKSKILFNGLVVITHIASFLQMLLVSFSKLLIFLKDVIYLIGNGCSTTSCRSEANPIKLFTSKQKNLGHIYKLILKPD